jgi:hypothetical protein
MLIVVLLSDIARHIFIVMLTVVMLSVIALSVTEPAEDLILILVKDNNCISTIQFKVFQK